VRIGRGLTGALLALALLEVPAQEVTPYVVTGDRIEQPLAGAAGDAARGRAIVASRATGVCLLCHSAPIPEERFQGTLAPDLSAAGARYSAAQLRLRIVDPRLVNAATFMPAFHSTANLARVGATWQGKPILTAQQVEDVVAYLASLR
jgi:L-cysteine S-thiosulfotransferase